MKKVIIIFLLLVSHSVFSQQVFNDFSSFLKYAESKSLSLQNTNIKEQQAKKAKLAAIMGIPDPQIVLNTSFTNNSKLPVTLLPGETFGGQPGTTKIIETGSPYVTNLFQSTDIKLFNFDGIKNYALSKINLDITTNDAKLTKKNLFENIAVTYYNIVLLNEQLKSTHKNLAVSDSLYQITKNKYDAGLVKQQDVNDSRVNYISLQENEKQIEYQIQQAYVSLKILADIPENENFVIGEIVGLDTTFQPNIQKNRLSSSYAALKEKYALEDYKRLKLSALPTLSFVSGFQYNHFSQDFKVSGNDWYNNSYIGLKLNIAIPNAKTITNRYNANFNYQTTINNTKQALIKEELDYQKLEIEWNKNSSQINSNKEITNIQKDTYHKNRYLYLEGLQSLDRTLNSLNTMINAEYNLNSSKVNLLLTKAKIDINNQIN